MVLGFKPQFVQPILNGTKIHTIREDKHDRWKPGMTIHFATGVRTKKYKQFKEKFCVSIQSIEIKFKEDFLSVYINGISMHGMSFLKTISKNDGFESEWDFLKFFKDGFKGKIIHWTNFKY